MLKILRIIDRNEVIVNLLIERGITVLDHQKPRVDPRILRTRQLIKDALIDLLQEMEISKITVNRIAERATINRVTFYLHYNDIQDMLEKMAQEMAEDIETIMMRTTP